MVFSYISTLQNITQMPEDFSYLCQERNNCTVTTPRGIKKIKTIADIQ